MRTTSPGSVVVAVDGTAADRPVLTWAAEEAERERRPVLLTHAAGHLPPQMTYAERHVARQEVRARSERLLEDAAQFVHRLVPALEVATVVRLLQPDALLPAVARDAATLTRGSSAWLREAGRAAEPVVAAVEDMATDAHVVAFAEDYAAHRGLDLTVLENRGPRAPQRVLTRAHDTSLLLLPRPGAGSGNGGYTWPVTLELVRRSDSPVVLVADGSDGEPAALPGAAP
jgi:hypothetical protein